MTVYVFTAELWLWDARRSDTWTFVTVPEAAAKDIGEWAEIRPPAGFGSVPVTVTVGSTTWRTSIFPTSGGGYALPVKKSVRRAEAVDAGDTVTVRLQLLDQ